MRLQQRNRLSLAIASVFAASLASTPVLADDHGDTAMSSNSSASAETSGDAHISPYMAPDDSWISISGSVAEVGPDAFALDYGDGIVTVEMDDGDRDADAYKLLEGDKVRVIGKIDDDFMETTSIEAQSVQLDKLGTTFYASAVDEEDVWMTVTAPITVSETIVNGTVKSVSDDDFTIDTGMSLLTVDVDDLPSNPLDDEGFLQIDVGDQVSVTGDMTRDFFEGRQLDADLVIELSS